MLLQTDISNLRDKISTYYSQYGKIPANTEYTNTSGIDVISSAVDTGKFYVIDLSALDNLTLNYGTDYEKIKSGEVTDVNTLSDLYIINDDSHNIFYVDGVTLDNQTFYTDYTTKDVDTEAVDLKYIDGVKIPDGFYYVGGTKDTGLVISDAKDDDLDNSKGGNQFVWIPVENKKDYERNLDYVGNEKIIDDTEYLPDGIDEEEKAVIDAGGFFLARYESGKENTNNLVIKKGATLWNELSYSEAKTISKTLYNNDEVKSALCSDIQWDMVMKFINGKKDGANEEVNVLNANEKRHAGVAANLGQNEIDKICNIYDLEGNFVEYVAGRYINESGKEYNIARGGSYRTAKELSYISTYDPNAGNLNTFRVVLYVLPENEWTKTYDQTGIYKDKNDDTATIPSGFQVSLVGSQNKITNGLVVRGPDESEFVWVPVDDINDMAQCSTAGGDCNLILSDGDELMCTTHNSTEIVGKLYATELKENFGTVNTTYNADDGLREPAIIVGSGTEFDNMTSYNNNDFSLKSLKDDYKNMATSVAKYGGFYVGRYETSLSTATSNSMGTSGTAQSKSGVLPTTAANSPTSLWYGLYKIQNKTYATKDDSVESSMIWGSQYDAILNWAKKGIDKNKITESSNGYHVKGGPGITGNIDCFNDSINNIRELEGNLLEWTLEAYNTKSRVFRGGSYTYNNTPGYRNNLDSSCGFADDGSRMTLYIK